jgi:hypothetical protein
LNVLFGRVRSRALKERGQGLLVLLEEAADAYYLEADTEVFGQAAAVVDLAWR